MDNKLINKIIKEKIDCYFISPHLDDSVLSAGSLLSRLNGKTKITVVNVFSNAYGQNTLSARQTLNNSGFNTAQDLYKERRNEDRLVLSAINVEPINLNYCEALWRKRKGKLINRIAKFFPEINTVYPTYKLHVVSGKISNSDSDLIKKIESDLLKIVDTNKKHIVFCPIGMGNHVDHLIVKKTCEKLFNEIIYWADFPYSLRSNQLIDPSKYTQIHILASKFKNKLINGYKTQSAMFVDSIIPKHSETFFIMKKMNNIDFPSSIAGFSFVSELYEEKNPKPYLYGLYINDKGIKAFAKLWTGKSRNINYYFLKNEINTYKLINRTLKSNSTFKKMNSNVHIPEIWGTHYSEGKLLILLENISGQQLQYASSYKKKNVYRELFSYFNDLNKIIDFKNTEVIKRGMGYWLSIFPLIATLSIVRNPKEAFTILKGCFMVASNLSCILKNKNTSLIHRDLGNWNIMTSGKKIFVYDFQLSCIGNPLLEIAATSFKVWKAKQISKGIIKIGKLKSKEDIAVFLFLAICLALYELSLNKTTDRNVAISYLKYQLGIGIGLNPFPSWLLTLTRNLLLFRQTPKAFLYSYTYSSKEKIRIYKYSPSTKMLAVSTMREINKIAPKLPVTFTGSASLKIMGEKDIDLIAVAQADSFHKFVPGLISLFGTPAKIKLDFIEWKLVRKGHSIDFTLLDPSTKLYERKLKIASLFQNNRSLVREYESVKRNAIGASLREYDRRKMEFYNRIVGV